MSYSKLFKVAQDFPLGFQTLNQARDNGEALKDLYDTRHAIGINGYSPGTNPFSEVGRHDDALIPRTVVRFAVDTSASPSLLFSYVTGPMLVGVTYDLTYTRLGTGQWRIYIATPAIYAGIATPEPTGAAPDQKANVYITNANFTPSVIVTTWDRAGGSWAKTDYNFFMCFWADRAL